MDDIQGGNEFRRCQEIAKRLEGPALQAGETEDLALETVERPHRIPEGYWRARLKVACADLLGTLRHGSQPALEALAKLLEDGDSYEDGSYDKWEEKVSLHAFTALVRIGTPAIPVLTHALGSLRPETRYEAAWALERNGPAAAEASAALEPLTRDPDAAVRSAAGGALGALSRGDESQRARVEQMLDEPATRLSGLSAARKLPKPDHVALIDRLIVLLGADPVPLVRAGAASQLGLLHEAADRAADTLVASVEGDPADDVRRTAMLALRQVGLSDPRIADGLFRALMRDEKPYASWSVGALTEHDASQLRRYVPEILARFEDPNDSLGTELVPIFETLGASAPPEVVRALASRLRSLRPDDVRGHVLILGALGAMGDAARSALPEIDRATAHPDQDVARRAAEVAQGIRGSVF